MGLGPDDQLPVHGDTLSGQGFEAGHPVFVKSSNRVQVNAQAHGGRHLVHVLAAGTGGTDEFKADVLVFDVYAGCDEHGEWITKMWRFRKRKGQPGPPFSRFMPLPESAAASAATAG
jgi:hypothetical protein